MKCSSFLFDQNLYVFPTYSRSFIAKVPLGFAACLGIVGHANCPTAGCTQTLIVWGSFPEEVPVLHCQEFQALHVPFCFFSFICFLFHLQYLPAGADSSRCSETSKGFKGSEHTDFVTGIMLGS